jgi:hypothetical protein
MIVERWVGVYKHVAPLGRQHLRGTGMITGRFLGSTSVSSIVVAIIVASSAAAQTAVAPNATADQSSAKSLSEAAADASGEIIVTANRRAEPLARVGVSVAAVSSAQLALFDVQQP